jgi:Uma2 family endonuclease
MAQAVLRNDDGYNRLAITVQMLEAMVASGTTEDPARVELIEGELVTMSPVHRGHARMTSKLNMLLSTSVIADFEVLENISIRLSDFNEPIVDLCVVKVGSDADVVAPSEAVLVIKVADSTARNDRLVKAKLYAKAGIPEFWIIDLNSSETVVHRGPSEAGWADVVSVPFAGEVVAAFDGAVRIVLRSDLA